MRTLKVVETAASGKQLINAVHQASSDLKTFNRAYNFVHSRCLTCTTIGYLGLSLPLALHAAFPVIFVSSREVDSELAF